MITLPQFLHIASAFRRQEKGIAKLAAILQVTPAELDQRRRIDVLLA